jgi:hypothetical protein
MTVTTNTQKEQTQNIESPGTEKTASDEQAFRDEFREDTQQFYRTFFRVGVRMALMPVYLLPEEPRDHFVSAGREFTRGFTSLAHELVETVEKFVDEVETALKRDV